MRPRRICRRFVRPYAGLRIRGKIALKFQIKLFIFTKLNIKTKFIQIIAKILHIMYNLMDISKSRAFLHFCAQGGVK